MAFRLYVGNYPNEFTRKDVENLFCDFDGITVEKICRKDSKSFSFLCCKDIDQLVSVIKKMNKTKVSGRNLIVRASDNNLQEYVDLILKSDESSVPDASSSSPTKIPLLPVQAMRSKYRQPHGNRFSEKSENMHNASATNDFQKSSPKSDEKCGVPANKSNYSYRQPYANSNSEKPDLRSKLSSINLQKSSNNYDENHGDSANTSNCSSRSIHNHLASDGETSGNDLNKVCNKRNPRNNESPVNNHHSSKSPMNIHEFPRNIESPKDNHHSSKSPTNNYEFPRNNRSPKGNPHYSKRPMNSYQTVNDENKHEYFERGSNCSSKSFHDNTNGTSVQDQDSSYAENFTEMRDSTSPTWVTVSNFRFYTPYRALFQLFSDYDPLQVRMISNVPRKDRSLCEALVCFPSREIADDVILNFDNTLFQGRIILVNDAEDSTILDELLSVTHS